MSFFKFISKTYTGPQILCVAYIPIRSKDITWIANRKRIDIERFRTCSLKISESVGIALNPAMEKMVSTLFKKKITETPIITEINAPRAESRMEYFS